MWQRVCRDCIEDQLLCDMASLHHLHTAHRIWCLMRFWFSPVAVWYWIGYHPAGNWWDSSIWISENHGVTATRNRLKMTGARTQPCLTPTNTSNGSDSWPSTVTLADMPSWNSRRIWRKCGGQPNLLTLSIEVLCWQCRRLWLNQWKRRRDWCCSRHFSCIDGRQTSCRWYRAHAENRTVTPALQCLLHVQGTDAASHQPRLCQPLIVKECHGCYHISLYLPCACRFSLV